MEYSSFLLLPLNFSPSQKSFLGEFCAGFYKALVAPWSVAGDPGVSENVRRDVCSGGCGGRSSDTKLIKGSEEIMESNQVTPEGIDETVSTLDGGVRKLAMDVALNQIEGWRLRLEASGVPEASSPSPTASGGFRTI